MIQHNFFSPEQKLLFACARSPLSPDKTEHIKDLLKENIDWDYFVKIVFYHKLTPLVYTHLNSFFRENVPDLVLAKLREYFENSSRRTLQMTAELIKILDLFAKQNIFVISYKGPILALMLYGQVHLRQFNDLDIIIHKKDALKAKNLLQAQGYHISMGFTDDQWDYIFRYHCDPTFLKNGVYMDLHWETHTMNEPLEERAQSIVLGNHFLHTFSPEHLFLVLCVHGAQHAWNRLNWISDITEMIEKYPEMNWSWILKRAENKTQKRMVLLALCLSENLFKIPIPNEAIKFIQKDPNIKKLVYKTCERLFKKKHALSRIFDITFHFSTMEGHKDKIRLLLKSITPKHIVRSVRFILGKMTSPFKTSSS